jgi:hypothetical protein
VVNKKKYEIKFDIHKLHKAFGKPSEEALRRTDKSYGNFETCEDCAVGKAKQKSTNNQWLQGIKNPGEIIYMDTSSIKGESFEGSKFWVFKIDDYINDCWSYFLNKKRSLKYFGNVVLD